MKTTIRYIASILIALTTLLGTTIGQTPEDTQPPTTPTDLEVIETHNTAIGINWNASTDNVGVAGYRIFVNDIGHGTSVDNEYIITGLAVNMDYEITVSAFDAASNESPQSVFNDHTTSTSSITGCVLRGGDPNTGAIVNLVGQGVDLETTVLSSCAYSFENLEAGIYELSVDGTIYYVQVNEGQTTVQDFSSDNEDPEVHTSPVTNITSSGAICGGTVIGNGVTDRGVIWSITPHITNLNSESKLSAEDEDPFISDLTGLLDPNTIYYIRAYASIEGEAAWGEEYSFYTGCNPMILNEIITPISQCGLADGALSITHLELDAPYTYNWTGPDDYSAYTHEITGLEAGNYEIIVTDKDGCETVKSYEISELPSIQIIIDNLVHESDYGASDGAISITPSGGSPSYIYAWTGPNGFTSSDEDISGLAQGLYTIMVTDLNLCFVSFDVEVGNPLVVTKSSDYNLLYEEEPVMGTLRYAMDYANENPGPDSISFNFMGEGPFTIYPTSNLPWISELLIIDGYSQSGASPASETTAANLMVELNGGSISSGDFRYGLVIIEDGSTIRGLVINGFGQSGILIERSDGNVIEGNYIGTNINGSTPIANDNNGILIIGGSDNLVGGPNPASRNIISGNVEYGISIEHIPEGDMALTNRIEGNYIGLAFDGMKAIPNHASGIYVTGSENIIGGEVEGAGNVISGNMEHGIFINYREAIGNQILGNIIGLDHTGLAPIIDGEGNFGSGIRLSNCLETIVGGSTPITRNIISGNQRGVYIFSIDFDTPYEGRHRILGNYIGTDITGKDAFGNRAEGVFISQEHFNEVGGSASGEGNLISGNGMSGIAMSVSLQDKILGNFIGTDVSGTKAIPNNHAGINLEACQGIYVGGPELGAGNLISANNGDGIVIRESEIGSTSGIYVKGNYIGTDISGTKALGNTSNESESIYGGNGIAIHGNVSYSWIGGTEANEGNQIAFNENCGVEFNNTLLYSPPTIVRGKEIRILSNSIHSNGSIGINLYDNVPDLVTPNDPWDDDIGPNGLQNYPEINSVRFSKDEVEITGLIHSVPYYELLLQFFASPSADEEGYGEGKTLIGSESVTTEGDGNFDFSFTFATSLRDGLVVTATATDPTGNTSEFSNAVGGAQDQVAEDMPMHFWIHEDGVPYISDGSDFQALQQSFDTWAAISTSEVDFVNEGPTDQAIAVANDEMNLITFMDEGFFATNDILGVAAKTLYMDDASGTAYIVDADIIFNPYNTQGVGRFSTDTHTGDYDLQSIATHELGHTFGMIHTGVLESTMFYSVMENTTDKRTLEQDDISWASYRYQSEDYDLTFGSISGNITYGDDPQLPVVGGALVIATNTSTGAAVHAYSDENGDYLVPGLPPGNYEVGIEPLDGNVQGYNLTQANISYYIDGITVYTDFPNEYYNGSSEGAIDDDPDESMGVSVVAGVTTIDINLVTNKDVTLPYVMAVTPKRDSIGASVMTQIFLGFSEPVILSTFVDETCYLTSDDGEVYGNFVVADNYGRRIAFTPREYPLDYSTKYELQITEGVTDLKGNPLEVPENPYTFTTEDPDLIPPEVTDMIPDHASENVFTNANIMVFFSEPMDASTTPNGFSVVDGSEILVEGDYLWNEDFDMLTFNPSSFLAEGTTYTVEVNSGMRDLSQNPLANDALLTFSTVLAAEPTITYIGPGPDQESVSLNSPLLIDFSEPIDTQTANADNIQIKLGDTPLTGTFEFVYENSRVVFRPDQLLDPNTVYNVYVSDQISDMSDIKEHLPQEVFHNFTTAETIDDPHIDYLQPSSGVPGTMVTIGGTGFDPNPDKVTVMFGDKEASIINIEPTFITTTVPIEASAGMVSIIDVDEGVSNEEYFYVVPINENPGDEIRRTVGTQAQAEDVVIEPDAAYAYVTNSGANSITRLNMITFEVQALPVGQMPVQIDIHPNGDMAYVSNHLSHDVSIIDLDLMEVVETIAVGINPYGLVTSPNGDLLFVANTTSEDVLYIDVDPFSGAYDKVVRGVNTSASNKGIAISPDAGLVLIACDEGILFLITDPDHDEYNEISRRVSTSASASSVEILPDAGMAVAATDDNYLVVLGIIPGNNYGAILGRVNTRGSVGDIDISPDGQLIYVTHPVLNEVSVYQIESTGAPNADASVNVSVILELVNVIEVDEAPYSLAVDPSGEKVLVGHFTGDGQISEIIVTGSIEVISTLEELIESVQNSIDDKVISKKYGKALLKFLNKTLSRYNSGKLNSALAQLDNFIKRVERWMEYGVISEKLGNDWLDAAYRIRAQLLRDLEAQRRLKKTPELGSGGGTMDDLQNINQRDLMGKQTLKLENRPNPFNYHTQVYFEIPNNGKEDIPVIMRVFNTSGQVVKTLVHKDMDPGRYSVMWNSDLDDGGLVPDGIYLLELRTPGERKAIRISVIK